MHSFLTELRAALRRLRHEKAVAAVAAVSLALAIAANANVFGGMRGLLLSALPYEAPDRLLYVWQGEPDPGVPTWITPANFLDLRRQRPELEDVAAISWEDMTLGDAGSAGTQTLRVQRITANTLALLGETAVWGRSFLAEDERTGAPDVALVSQRFWQGQLGRRTPGPGERPELVLQGKSHRVVGILAEDFELLDAQIDVWVPLRLDPASAPRQSGGVFAIARLQPSASLESARQALRTFAAGVERNHPDTARDLQLHAIPLKDRFVDGRVRNLVTFALAATVLLLLIVTANLTNLFYARAERLRGEVGLRLALGAGRRDLVRLLLLESQLLAGLGSLGGLALAGVAHRVIAASPMWAQVPQAIRPRFDWSVVATSLVLSLLVGTLVGLLPALRATRSKPASSAPAGHGRQGVLSKGLVTAQLAAGLALVAGTGILVESFARMEAQGGGYDSSDVLVTRVALPESVPRDGIGRAFELLLQDLRSTSAIEEASVMLEPPRSPGNRYARVRLPGRDETRPAPQTILQIADERYLELLRIPLLAGRGLDAPDVLDDVAGVERDVWVNDAFRRRFFPDAPSALGERFQLDDTPVRVAGILGDTQQEMTLDAQAPPMVVSHFRGVTPRSMLLAVRSRAARPDVAQLVEQALATHVPSAPRAEIRSLDELVSSFYVGFRLYATFMGFFGLVALAIAGLGIYGVTAYSVARRTAEMALRRALGATSRHIVWRVLREGATLALLGAALGLPCVWLVQQALAGILSGTSPASGPAAAVASATLMVVALMGCLLPTLAALRAQPAQLLREQ